MTPAIHRREATGPWREVTIICALPWGKFLVQQVGPILPGRFLASREDLRVDAGPSLRVVNKGCGPSGRGTEATPSCFQGRGA